MAPIQLPDWTTLLIVGGSITAQLMIVVTAWFKFKTELQARTNEIKYHSDVSVQKLNGMLTSVIMSFDRPAWVKVAHMERDKVVFRMLEINNLYGELYGVERQDYIGKTDLEAGWPKESADSFYNHDVQVWSTGESSTFNEVINGKSYRFRKIRVTSSTGKIKGVMGYAVDCGEPDLRPFHGETKKIEELLKGSDPNNKKS